MVPYGMLHSKSRTLMPLETWSEHQHQTPGQYLHLAPLYLSAQWHIGLHCHHSPTL